MNNSKSVVDASYASMDDAIDQLPLEELEQPSAIAITFAAQVERLVLLYAALEPILDVFASHPLLPPRWRKALTAFIDALGGVLASPELHVEFKAGKDI